MSVITGQLPTILSPLQIVTVSHSALEQLLVDGSVDTKKTGTYQVNYSIVTDEAATPNFFARLFGTDSQEAVTATATIKVIEKAEEPEEEDQQPEKDDSDKGQENQRMQVSLANKAKRPQRTNGCYQRPVQPSLKAIRLQEQALWH